MFENIIYKVYIKCLINDNKDILCFIQKQESK